MAQWLPEAEAHASKITEFGITFHGRTARWHSQLDITSFPTFDQLQSSFLRFFHSSIPRREIISQFYTIKQSPKESVADFSLQFQSLHRQLIRILMEEYANNATQSLEGETADMVIEQALQLELEYEDEGLSMASLRQALP